ncbi:hypothetical protein SUGI_0110500 [Cryptomeria japonica]|nr:hypothetical protein SUGI_0110500 [Cryptomeria japonica]
MIRRQLSTLFFKGCFCKLRMVRWIAFCCKSVNGEVDSIAALCAKEYKNQHKNRRSMACTAAPPGCLGNWKVKAESRGRGLIKTFRSKSLLLSKRWQRSEKEEGVEYAGDAKEDSDFLWQKRILMGVRCKPLNFSGQIQYDQNGERLPKFPLRSPKPNNVFLPSPKVDKEAN